MHYTLCMSVCIAYSGSTYPNPTKNALVQQVQFHPRQGRSTQTIRCLYEFVPPASSGAHWPVLHLSMPLDFPSHDFASSHAARYFVLMASSCPSLAPLHKPTFPFSLRDSRRCHSRRFKNFVAKCVHANKPQRNHLAQLGLQDSMLHASRGLGCNREAKSIECTVRRRRDH